MPRFRLFVDILSKATQSCTCSHDSFGLGGKILHQCQAERTEVEFFPPPPRQTRASRLERLPPEISLEIYKWACLDFGETGIRLSLTSKTIRDDSAPCRFQSIGIFGVGSILRVHALLQSLPKPLRQVRHLFLTNQEYEYSGNYRSTNLSYCDCPFPARQPNGPVLRLLRLIPDTLQTLSLSLRYYEHDTLGASISFPRLRVLNMDIPLLKVEGNLLPSIRHLHTDREALPKDLFCSAIGSFPSLQLLQIAYSADEGSGKDNLLPSDITDVVTRLGYKDQDFFVNEIGALVLRGVGSRDLPGDVPSCPQTRSSLSIKAKEEVACAIWPGTREFIDTERFGVRMDRDMFAALVAGDNICCQEAVSSRAVQKSATIRQTVLRDLWAYGPF